MSVPGMHDRETRKSFLDEAIPMKASGTRGAKAWRRVLGSLLGGPSRFPGVALTVAVVLWFLAMRAVALFFLHPLIVLDGAMQTWFALDEFADGRQLGRDFQSYLGVTMILSLLPVYEIFGGSLFASSVAASAAMAMCLLATAYGIVRLIGIGSPATRWILIAAVAAVLMSMTALNTGNSLRPVRWGLPFLMLPFVMQALLAMRKGVTIRAGLVLGAVGGVGVLWSNDSGIPAFASLGLAILLCGAGGWRQTALTAMVYVLSAFVIAGAILLAVTHGEPGGWLSYNFGAVRQDQIWYFAPWARDHRIMGLSDITLLIDEMRPSTRVAVALLAGSVGIAILRRLRGRGSPIRLGTFVFVGLTALGTSLIPQIGGPISDGYSRGTIVIGLAAPFIVFRHRLIGALRLLSTRMRSGRVDAALLCMLAILIAGLHSGRTAAGAVIHGWGGIYVPELGLVVAQARADDLSALREMRQSFDAAAVAAEERVQSTYPSAVGILLSAEAPTAFGAIIHALGAENRGRFTEVIAERRVPFALTAHYPMPFWPDWNIRSSWPYFRALHLNFEPVAQNPEHILWRQREVPLAPPGEPVECQITPGDVGSVDLFVESPVDGHVELRVELATLPGTGDRQILTATEDSPFTRVPDFKAWLDAPRYGIPRVLDHVLFLPVAANEPSSLRLEVIDGARIDVASCSAVQLDWPSLSDLPSFRSYLDQTGRPLP